MSSSYIIIIVNFKDNIFLCFPVGRVKVKVVVYQKSVIKEKKMTSANSGQC